MISALILAAGRSTRMGQPKMLLPWGESTVLGTVIDTVRAGGVDEILVITGGSYAEVGSIAARHNVRTVYNPYYVNGEMLSSIQCGIRFLSSSPSSSLQSPHLGLGGGREGGALICLGDQPQVQARSVELVCAAYRQSGASLIVPSFQKRRGHPWLVVHPLWEPLLALEPPQTPRDFLNAHSEQIQYVDVDHPSILADLDTPDDYLKSRP